MQTFLLSWTLGSDGKHQRNTEYMFGQMGETEKAALGGWMYSIKHQQKKCGSSQRPLGDDLNNFYGL